VLYSHGGPHALDAPFRRLNPENPHNEALKPHNLRNHRPNTVTHRIDFGETPMLDMGIDRRTEQGVARVPPNVRQLRQGHP